MQVFRFMSKLEFEKYKHNITLKNNRVHDGKTNIWNICRTN